MNQKQLNIGIITNNPAQKTGLARCVKAWLPLVYKTGKYNIFFLNQGMPDNDPIYQKFPWKNFGVFKNFDQNRFNTDPNFQRWVAYGNAAVEDFIISNRIDVAIHADDIWSAENYLRTDWFNHMKQNFIQWSTIDSEPALPAFKDWAENCPNLWFWASFGERILKEENIEKYGHVKTLYPAFNTKDFYPLPENERLELRHKFGIKDDEKVIIYVFRNQLRKLAFAHMEALAEWKKLHPDKKIRLLFHTSWSEPAGWPLDRIREELKLDKEDILTTYFCRNCGEWNVQCFQGEDLDCQSCKGQKSKITAGISSTIDEKNLNKIYNLADGACSCATSGGSELFSQESMLAGIPFSSFPYSCGEDYVKNDFVHKLRGTYTREVNTSFKKFVPEIKSLVEFYDIVWNLSKKEKEKITTQARQWTIDNFDAEIIANKLMTFFDSCKSIDWDTYLSKKQEIKPINAQIEDKVNDNDFITECYLKILNMTPSAEDEGRKYWQSHLSQPKDKNQLKNEMVNLFRSEGHKHNMKVQPQSFESLLDPTDKSRVLIYLPQSLGDLYILTSLLPEIQNKYPNSSIYIGCDIKYHEIFENNSFVKKCLPILPEMQNEMIMVGFANNKGLFNHYINVGLSTQSILNYLSNKY